MKCPLTNAKYLGIIHSHRLKWKLWTDLINTMLQQKKNLVFLLFLLFNAHNKILEMVYCALSVSSAALAQTKAC